MIGGENQHSSGRTKFNTTITIKLPYWYDDNSRNKSIPVQHTFLSTKSIVSSELTLRLFQLDPYSELHTSVRIPIPRCSPVVVNVSAVPMTKSILPPVEIATQAPLLLCLLLCALIPLRTCFRSIVLLGFQFLKLGKFPLILYSRPSKTTDSLPRSCFAYFTYS